MIEMAEFLRDLTAWPRRDAGNNAGNNMDKVTSFLNNVNLSGDDIRGNCKWSVASQQITTKLTQGIIQLLGILDAERARTIEAEALTEDRFVYPGRVVQLTPYSNAHEALWRQQVH